MGGWMPGATIMRGHNAGYRAGRVLKQSAVAHYTVGINSAGIGVQGYFNFLIRRNGEIVQFAESDAVTWHAGNWNSRGPGIEVEYYEPKDGPPPDNIFTDDQLESCGRVVRWLHEADGYPLDFHDGPRVSAHRGTITHRSLIQTGDAHHDYWSHDQWDRMIRGGTELNDAEWKRLEGYLHDRDKNTKREVEEEGQKVRVQVRKLMRPVYDHLDIPWPKDES